MFSLLLYSLLIEKCSVDPKASCSDQVLWSIHLSCCKCVSAYHSYIWSVSVHMTVWVKSSSLIGVYTVVYMIKPVNLFLWLNLLSSFPKIHTFTLLYQRLAKYSILYIDIQNWSSLTFTNYCSYGVGMLDHACYTDSDCCCTSNSPNQ